MKIVSITREWQGVLKHEILSHLKIYLHTQIFPKVCLKIFQSVSWTCWPFLPLGFNKLIFFTILVYLDLRLRINIKQSHKENFSFAYKCEDTFIYYDILCFLNTDISFIPFWPAKYLSPLQNLYTYFLKQWEFCNPLLLFALVPRKLKIKFILIYNIYLSHILSRTTFSLCLHGC